MFIMTQTSTLLPLEVHHLAHESTADNFEPNIEDLWNLDMTGIKDLNTLDDDDAIRQAVKDSIIKKNGRYEVTWPWKEENLNLADNYDLCVGRLKFLMKRFESNPELLEQYNNVVKKQLSKGIIEKVDEKDLPTRRHYKPHHAVINPNKSTTKIRIVYDASAKKKNGMRSLNQCLSRGPIILEDMCALLLRGRTKRIGIIADIEKAFLKVGLQDQDRDVTRFLWIKDTKTKEINNNIET